MKKVWITLGIILMGMMLTGCEKKTDTPTIQERQVKIVNGIHSLECTGVSKEKKTKLSSIAKITYDYDQKSFQEGTLKITLKFEKKLTQEDKNNLKDLSFCSSDMMGTLSSFGECTTEVGEKELVSTLKVKKELVPSDYSLERIKVELESIPEINSTCEIK
ncbi:MAG: hypothetical protein IJ193_01085 [Bacilli bacterium]|nr:hypothetical protein [Bacilli bacterium]